MEVKADERSAPIQTIQSECLGFYLKVFCNTRLAFRGYTDAGFTVSGTQMLIQK